MPPRKKAKQSGVRADGADPVLAKDSTAPGASAQKETRVLTQARARSSLHGRHASAGTPRVPWDVLLEIFGFMHPRDLLTMARTSTTNRTFLMSRKSVRYWRAARQQVEPPLPECPSFLSEPAYANLVFFSHCHECTRPNVKTVIWEFLARYCQKCRRDMLWEHTEVFFRVCIMDAQGRAKKINYLNVIEISSSPSAPSQLLYHSPEVVEFLEKFHPLLQRNADTGPLIHQEAAQVKLRAQFADAMKEWAKKNEQHRVAELQAVTDYRLRDVKQRLRDEGWGEELDTMIDVELENLKGLKSVRQPRLLTERGWKSARTEIVGFMEEVRAQHLERDRTALLVRRLTILSEVFRAWEHAQWGNRGPLSDCRATFADLALAPVFRALVEAPSDVQVTKEAFQEHSEKMAVLCARWSQERQEEFTRMVTEAVKSTMPDGVDPLSLAIAAFDCRICARSGMRWPNVLAHPCARSYAGRDDEDSTTVDKYKGPILTVCRETGDPGLWTNVFVFSLVHDRTCAVISACGKDPNTATCAEMEACGVRLVCRTCATGKLMWDIYDWMTAIQHGFIVGHDDSKHELRVVEAHPPAFGRLNAARTQQVLSFEPAWRARSWKRMLSEQGRFGCTRCRASMTAAQIAAHCLSKHQVAQPRTPEDYYVHLDNRREAEPVHIVGC